MMTFKIGVVVLVLAKGTPSHQETTTRRAPSMSMVIAETAHTMVLCI